MLVRTLVLIVMTAGLLVPAGATGVASATPDNFTPSRGATFNNPTGSFTVRRAIFRKIMRSINSSPGGSDIRFFTWNFLTMAGADALLKAQRRGVQVKVLMDEGNDTEIDNGAWRRLRSGLRAGNRDQDRPKGKRSWARVCSNTCRGNKGSAHSKFFLFSEAGKARRVVIQGSANFTLASTNNQWNDVYTHVGNKAVWRFANTIFREAAQDKPAKEPYARLIRSRMQLHMFPHIRTQRRDPVMQLLRSVRCQGATNTASRRTVIRIAPDVLRSERGMWLARRLREMWRNGCDIKIGYTVIGKKHGRMLRAAGVPLRHLVQDFNGDGEFDNYFHLKAMSIRGRLGDDRSAWAVLNGSANWSGLARVSDENLGIYYKRGLTRKYEKHIEYWYDNFPSDGSARGTTGRRAAADQRLVFGSGPNAVYEDGTPVSDGTFDPFANIDLD